MASKKPLKKYEVAADPYEGGPVVTVDARNAREARKKARPKLSYGWRIGRLEVTADDRAQRRR